MLCYHAFITSCFVSGSAKLSRSSILSETISFIQGSEVPFSRMVGRIVLLTD